MTEREKMIQGLPYNAGDPELMQARRRCKELCFAFNQTPPSQRDKQQALLRSLLVQADEKIHIEPNLWCDYGCNIEIGENFFMNHNGVILDGAKVTFGDNVFIAPNCLFSTAGHPLDTAQRNRGLEYAYPITVGDNVWFGAGVIVLPGVTIGSDTVIGAGSLVNRDIPAGVVAAGNPCRVIRPLTAADRDKYPRAAEDL